MTIVLYAVVILIALLGSLLAGTVERRSQKPLWARCIAGVTSVTCLAATYLLTVGPSLPLPWPSTGAQNSDPWQGLVLPLAVAALLWSSAGVLQPGSDAVRMWAAMAVATVCWLGAMPAGESYADVLPGNAVWLAIVVLATGAGFGALRSLNATGGGSLILWILTALTASVSAVLLSCYGTLGEFCLALCAATAVAAVVRSCSANAAWHDGFCVVPWLVAPLLLSHVRIYKSAGLSPVSAGLLLAFPVIVCAADYLLVRNASLKWRTVLAGAISAVLSGVVIASLFAGSSAQAESW